MQFGGPARRRQSGRSQGVQLATMQELVRYSTSGTSSFLSRLDRGGEGDVGR